MKDTSQSASGTKSTESKAAPKGAAAGKNTLTGRLQKKSSGGGGGGGGSAQETAAAGFSGAAGGVPYQSQMEQGFGVSFSGVQVYSGGAAAEANTSLGSEAYAVGQQVAFKSPNPAPAVVAHELAHTIQQGDAGPVQTWTEGSPGDSFEQEADAAAATVLSGGTATVSQRTGAGIQKWSGADHYTLGNTAGQKAFTKFAAMFGPNAQPGTPRVTLPDAADGTTVNGSTALGGGVRTGGVGQTEIGTSADQSTMGISTNNGGLISMGSASRAAGDYAGTVGDLAGRNSETGTSGAGGGSAVSNGREQATVYVALATNSNHFFPLHIAEWQGHHQTALGLAHAAAAMGAAGQESAAKSLMTQAMQEEAFANHFLQDTFASGHAAPRSLDSIGNLTNETPTVVARTMQNVVSGGRSIGRSAGTGAGRVLGGIGGAIGGFFSSAVRLENPFAGAAQGASQGADSLGNSLGDAGDRLGGAVTSPATAIGNAADAVASIPGHLNDAAGGLTRTRDWHDYFCALPNGLPTTLGNFHGDHHMDGNDLEIVSEMCSQSIMEVLSAGQGAGVSYGIVPPRPNFSAIMDDPMAGPVWRLMMQDYQASMNAARSEVTADDRGKTDGETGFNSREVVDDIYNEIFGGAAGEQQAASEGTAMGAIQGIADTAASASADPVGTVNAKRIAFKGVLDSISHYAAANWGRNANLGNVTDDLNVNNTDDPNTTGFDAVALERTYGHYSNLARTGREFALAATVARSGGQLQADDTARLTTEINDANEAARNADTWVQRCNELYSMGDDLRSHLRGNVRQDGRVQLRTAIISDVARWRVTFGAAGEYQADATASGADAN